MQSTCLRAEQGNLQVRSPGEGPSHSVPLQAHFDVSYTQVCGSPFKLTNSRPMLPDTLTMANPRAIFESSQTCCQDGNQIRSDFRGRMEAIIASEL